jgi:hypothetical protein
MHCRIGWAVVVSAIGSAAMLSDVHAQTRGVIELFTSQGCSSCPPADQLLGRLAEEPAIVAMSLPIDYWDYLGWKDTLASPENTARQRSYARARGDMVYTPQVVVNGKIPVPGTNEQAITQALADSRRDASILMVPVELAFRGEELAVTIPAGASSVDAQIWVCGLSSSMPVTIERGENRGHTLTYYNVIRHRLKVGDWTGAAVKLRVPTADFVDKTVDRVAVIVQAGTLDNPGPVLGAAIQTVGVTQAHTSR